MWVYVNSVRIKVWYVGCVSVCVFFFLFFSSFFFPRIEDGRTSQKTRVLPASPMTETTSMTDGPHTRLQSHVLAIAHSQP